MTDHLPSHVGRVVDAETGYALICNRERSTNGPLCGNRATWHLIWTDDAENSLTCDEHVADGRALSPLQVHSTTNSACGMPGSMWLKDEGYCVMDCDGVEPPALSAVVREGQPA